MTFFIADRAPSEDELTDYDRAHVALYLRLLDADRAKAAWDEVAGLLLSVDPGKERDLARLRYETHLQRARWMTERGYFELLKAGRA